MKGCIAFLVLTLLSCGIGYLFQIAIQNERIKSKMTDGLRFAADFMESKATALSSIDKTSKFNINSPHYLPDKSLQNRRNQYVKLCSRYSDPMRPESTPHEPNFEAMLGFFSHNLVFCTNKRVGVKKIKNLSIQTMTSNTFNILDFKKYFPESLKSVSHHAIVVRHPMERLISAYRAEFEEIINVESGDKKPARMSFPDFINIVVRGKEILDEYRRKVSGQGESVMIDTSLVDGKGLSSVWDSYWNHCGLCHPAFDPKYIIHLETFKEDFEVINREVMNNYEKMRDILAVKETAINTPSSDSEIIEYYYSQLSKEEIQSIYDKYRPDHELFGYTPDYFMQFGKKSRDETAR